MPRKKKPEINVEVLDARIESAQASLDRLLKIKTSGVCDHPESARTDYGSTSRCRLCDQSWEVLYPD